jgi:cytochrome b pre-mRNA-processing protein 3
MLARIFRKKSIKLAARELYDALSLAGRDPMLYGPGRVTDSPDGRFELLALHASVFFTRMSKRGEQAEETSQEVFDILFSTMDHALRELGVGDISVGKRIRKLAESFYGRLAIYHETIAIQQEQPDALSHAISTHIFELSDGNHPFAPVLAKRLLAWSACLDSQSDADLLSGKMVGPRGE